MHFAAALVVTAALAIGQQSAGKPPTAARSVHLGYATPPANAMHVAMTIEQTTPGSYFMAAGWHCGYFGLQELGDGKKVALFSVWDPTKGDDPKAVKPEDRVECVHQCDGARIKRFGGEGTGGQCMIDFDWQLGDTQRCVVTAEVDGDKTSYAGFLWQPATKSWLHLVTFRVRSGGKALHGLYSFVEDFRRDGKSVLELRRARYGDLWVLPPKGEWQAVRSARFTASGSPQEDKLRIGAGVADGAFFLAAGGAAKGDAVLDQAIELPAAASAVPKDLPPLPPKAK